MGFTKFNAVVPLRTHDPYIHIFFVAPSVEFVTKMIDFLQPFLLKWPFLKTECSSSLSFFFFQEIYAAVLCSDRSLQQSDSSQLVY